MNNPTTPPTIQNIRLYLIQPSRLNPRKTIDNDLLRELADNISRQGLLQPITCIVREMTDEEAFDAMITENLQRVDVDPMEEAEAFNLLRDRGKTVEELALRFGKSERYVRDRMRLVSLSEPLQKALSIGQIPLKGAYLLSRLTDDDQQEFFDDQLDGDHRLNITADEVEDWLDKKFRKLYSAPFQEKGSLRETWNPDGQLVRRCDTCECNTRNHGCLFADMRKEEPQCTDENCYKRKLDIYIDWFISQYNERIVREGEPATKGKMHIFADEPYGEEAKRRYKNLAETLRQKGYRLFNSDELSRWYGAIDEKMKKGECVEGISLSELSNGYCVQIRHFLIMKNSGYAQTSQQDKQFMASRLVERAASIEKTTLSKIVKFAKGRFNREEYVKRQDSINNWEENIILAILYDQMGYPDREDITPGCNYYGMQTYQEAAGLGKMDLTQLAMLKRKAIAAYCAMEKNRDFFIQMASRLSYEVESYAAETRQEARQRIDAIHDELREMGFDENGNLL